MKNTCVSIPFLRKSKKHPLTKLNLFRFNKLLFRIVSILLMLNYFVLPNCNAKAHNLVVESNNLTLFDGVIIDNTLPDLDYLVNEFSKAQVSQNEQIVHLVSHGKPGKLFLNGKWQSTKELVKILKPLVFNKQHLNIYACNFARGKVGKNAVKYLEDALQINIAASNNTTGKDGDWILEVGNSIAAVAIENYNFNLFDCERVAGGDFSDPTAISNWSLSAGSQWTVDATNGRINNAPYANGNVDDSLYQVLNNLPSNAFTLSFDLRAHRHNNTAGHLADLWIYIGGTLYAQFSNGTTENSGTLTLSNGATCNLATIQDHNWTTGNADEIELTIPWTGPSSAALVFKMTAPRNCGCACGFFGACTSWGADYFALNDISILGKDSDALNTSCSLNSTTVDLTDDYITFNLNPTPGTGSYNITASSGTITPTTGTFGSATTFQLFDGSVGTGDVILTMTDMTENCTFEAIVIDPVCCLPTCGNLVQNGDFTDGSNNWTVTGAWDFTSVWLPTNFTSNGNNTAGASDVLSQTINGLSVGEDVVIKLDVMGQNDNNADGDESEMVLSLDGTDYVTFFNPLNGTVGSVTANTATSASVDVSTFIITTNPLTATATSVEITIPSWAGGTSALLALTFNVADNVADDFYMGNITILKGSATLGSTEFTNIVCNNNSTVFDAADDFLTFDFNPAGTGTYNVSSNDVSITPTSGTFGNSTTFTYQMTGTTPGNIDIQFIDITGECKNTKTIFNPGDCLPGPCGSLLDVNTTAEKANVTATTTTIISGTIGNLADGNNGGNNFFFEDNSTPIDGDVIIKYEFTKAISIQGFEIICSGRFITSGSELIAQGSNDDTTWTNLENITVPSPETSPAQWGGTGNVMSFPFLDNMESYKYYRLLGVSGNTDRFNWVYETYFNYTYAPTNITNVLYINNETPNILSDDTISFQLNPTFETPNVSYDIEMESSLSVSPTSGVSGTPTTFTIKGSTDDKFGFRLINITDLCLLEDSVINPACYPDYEVEAINVTCSNAMSNDDATIVLNSVDANVTKINIVTGGTYNGPDYANSLAISGTFPMTLDFDIANPDYDQPYTVRLFCDANNYTDTTVLIKKTECSIADLSVSVNHPTQTANIGEFVTYDVELENAGPHTALDVEILVDIPLNAEFAAATTTLGDYSIGTNLWTLPQVVVGTQTLTITYKVK